MKHLQPTHPWLAAVLACALLAGGAAAAENKADAEPAPQAAAKAQHPHEAQSPDKAAEKPQSGDQTRGKAAEERAKIVEEAVTALARTNTALRALDAGDTNKALEDLAVAVGKLELIVAAHPDMALAPVDVRVITQDLVATPADVKKAVKQAEDLLEDGRVQDARAILRDLGSEVIVRVVNIPLATYPDAIKAVAPLIQSGKIAEAKQALVAALGTLVVVDNVIPLPVMRAERALDEAKTLAATKQRDDEQNKRLSKLLQYAREQLELAEALGYGDEKAFAPLLKTIREIEKNTAGGGTEEGLFDRIKKEFEKLRAKL